MLVVPLFPKSGSYFFTMAKAEKLIDIDVLRKEIHDYWHNNPEIIDQFLKDKGSVGLTEEQRQLLLSWKHGFSGKFMCVKYYDNFSVFRLISNHTNDKKYYAVLGLIDDFDDLMLHKPPCVVSTLLLPYKDVIICNGVMEWNVMI